MSASNGAQNAWLVSENLPLVSPNEELPLYSSFDLVETLGRYTVNSTANSQITDVPELLPTELLVTRGAGFTTATQLLMPKGNLEFVIEDIFNTTVTVHADRSGLACNGLVYVSANLRHENLGNDLQTPIVHAISKTDEKTDTKTLYFGLGSEHAGKKIHMECKIILPTTSALSELSMRLPSRSQLEISQIKQHMVQSLNVAMVAGTIQLVNVSAEKLRIAVARGSIGAVDIMASKLVEFIAVSGQIQISKCISDKTVRVNSPEATLFMRQVVAKLVSIKGRQAGISMCDVRTQSGYINTNCGAVNMDRVEAEVLDVYTDTAPVRGSWAISQRLIINVRSAIIQGELELVGDCVHTEVKTKDWPVHLAVSESFRGYFDVRTANSVARFGLSNTILYEQHSHWLQGVVGAGASRLTIENSNSPVVVTPN
ncbi:hypothetical protein H4S08_000368 [Coemansia sp. RSA 1365]|nr:hypothetical protein H4S08_000368 [Coemansia sp. RSA 1365]